MDKDQFEAIVKKLDSIIRLLGVSTVKGMSIEQSIVFLNSMGFAPSEIATIIGRTPNQVSVTLSQYKKKQKIAVPPEREETEVTPREVGQVNA